jgi:RNA polymerase sigma factor (sigma-70 family)
MTPAKFTSSNPPPERGSLMATNESHGFTQQALWAAAYKKYFRLWMNLALNVYFDPKEAEEVVHAVMHSAMTREGEGFASLEHIRNYVAKAVLNRAYQGRQRDERMVRWDEKTEGLFGIEPTTLEIEDNEQMQILRSVLVGLKPHDFEIVKLRYFGGFTFQEISQILGLALSTIKSREESALKKIRTELRKKGIELLEIDGRRGAS